MNLRRTTLLLIAPLTLLAPEVLRYAPQQGAKLRKEIKGTAHLVQTIETLSGGSEHDAPFQVTADIDLDLELIDHYRELATRRPQTLNRELKKAGLNITTELLVDIEDGAKPLRFAKSLRSERAKTPVVFRWQEDQSAFSAQLATSDGSPGLHLDRLREETDLRSFLPEEEVDAGSTWNVPVAALADVFSPGGDLAFRFESGGHATHDDFKVFGTDLGAMLLDADSATNSGAVQATYRGHDKNRKHLARIEVRFEIDHGPAATRTLQRLARDLSDRQRSLDAESKRFRLRGTGTVLWNTKTSLPASAEFNADLDAEWLVTSRSKTGSSGGARVVTDRRTITGTLQRTFTLQSTR
ncbi:MAG: hypothetical protein AAF368_03440 [Planctomycetota bacterium]